MNTYTPPNAQDLDAMRAHPATLAMKRKDLGGLGLPMRKAEEYAASEGQPVSHAKLQDMIKKLRAADGDDWLSPSFLRLSEAYRKAPDFHAYPIYARVPGGSFNGCATADLEPTGDYVTDLRVRQKPERPAPFAMEVRGDSMTNPASPVQFPDGSRVLCDPGQTPDLGDFVVVIDVTDESLTLKRLVNKGAPGERDLWLEPLNPAFVPMKYEDSRHQVAGVVVDAQMPLYRKPSKTGRR